MKRKRKENRKEKKRKRKEKRKEKKEGNGIFSLRKEKKRSKAGEYSRLARGIQFGTINSLASLPCFASSCLS
jgi:hypothetical protein